MEFDFDAAVHWTKDVRCNDNSVKPEWIEANGVFVLDPNSPRNYWNKEGLPLDGNEAYYNYPLSTIPWGENE